MSFFCPGPSHMSSRTSRGIAYERLPCEDIDTAFEGSLDSDTESRNAIDDEFPDRQHVEQSLLRKVDLRMSILVLIYILNYIDRNNAAAARLRGFEDDLHLEGQQFNTILSILYVGYTLMQVPSNMYLNKIGRPSIYLPICMVMWGLISILTGTTTGFRGAVCTRFFLGFVEAAFFPGALFLLSKWYKRRELGQRTAILSCGIMISNAFGSLLASAILDGMDGVMGQAAWRWLFYIEGSMTVLVAICAIFILPDFPTTSCDWLTAEEQALAQFRMEEDVGVDDETECSKGGESGLKQAFSDWKVWWLALAMTLLNVLLSFNAFFPTLSATLGYSSTVSLLLCSPPWLFATCVAFFTSRHSDETGERFGHITIPLLVGIAGFMMAMATMNTAVRYFSLFLMAQSYTAFVVYWAWVSNSIPRPTSKRAVALAFINAFSSSGNIIGSYVWPKSWGPSYWNSYAICIGSGALCIIMSWIFRRHLMRLNQEIETKKIEEGVSKDFTYLL
ncbi:MFS general substrate transporter [Suillus clintonianus]|uniref:MFS general substrate transporter n=1 Tax=Suillus clintonianus TaxID=1904413 RepID=UPI001B867500|nr:MFS general substrate transporter [Suillus clintonianus]KAG2146784.1 MFS general substrate transporter [Suillus clintonianus]